MEHGDSVAVLDHDLVLVALGLALVLLLLVVLASVLGLRDPAKDIVVVALALVEKVGLHLEHLLDL